MNYYNEKDKFAAAWLRELIAAGYLPRGDVDERSIEDVTKGDLDGYRQHHFFAGIGGWSLALRLAGWPDDKPVWTGSCPCQPFSAAGQGGGFADERHLWPTFHWLITQCRPGTIFGEQVASPDGLAWVDLVQTDVEAEGYAFAPFDLCAAGVGAPHIRQRLFWVADANSKRSQGWRCTDNSQLAANGHASTVRTEGGVADAPVRAGKQGEPQSGERPMEKSDGSMCPTGRMADYRSEGRRQVGADDAGRGIGSHAQGLDERSLHRSFWSAADWLTCRDGKTRPVEPGTFPLAYGVSARMGRLRGYGNAIVPQVAAEVIRAFMETT